MMVIYPSETLQRAATQSHLSREREMEFYPLANPLDDKGGLCKATPAFPVCSHQRKPAVPHQCT
jgi:hypothetical protein